MRDAASRSRLGETGQRAREVLDDPVRTFRDDRASRRAASPSHPAASSSQRRCISELQVWRLDAAARAVPCRRALRFPCADAARRHLFEHALGESRSERRGPARGLREQEPAWPRARRRRPGARASGGCRTAMASARRSGRGARARRRARPDRRRDRGMRDDALARLDRFAGHWPSPCGNLLMLERLDAGAGREAMEAPARASRARALGARSVQAQRRTCHSGGGPRRHAGIEGRGGTEQPERPRRGGVPAAR